MRVVRKPFRAWAAGAVALLVGVPLSACSSSSSSTTTTTSLTPTASTSDSGRVLLVGTFHGHRGRYASIQAAVNAARPGDWILVAPGDYHETSDLAGENPNAKNGATGGVTITVPRLHLRGMSRSGVVVDGTRPGAPECSSAAGDQEFGPPGPNGKPAGRNGIVVWKANGVSIQNLSACNFLSGSGDAGNEIWWNGGDNSARIGMKGYFGSYLTATSTYYGGESTAAAYGIFSSDAAGPALLDQTYASNFNDSGLYIGACQMVCDVTVNHAWMEYSALGYSGTNSGGTMVIENSQFDHNKDGFDTNTQINGDPPAPQNGACPNGGISPITHTHSCWVFWHNYSHDNNDPNVPQAGTASQGPVGTGMTLSGGRNDTVMDNVFADNGAWGMLMVPYPDSSTPEYNQSCSGTGGVETPGFGCVYDPMENALVNNTFRGNAFFGNPGNADYGMITLDTGQPRNCFRSNVAPKGSAPADLEQSYPTCGAPSTSAVTGGPLLAQVLCDTGFGTCPAGSTYPTVTRIVMHPLPKGIPNMPNPCAGVPDNPWCAGGKPVG